MDFTRILLGTLRNELKFLGVYPDDETLEQAARDAVLQGRAQETFAVGSPFYFSASQVNWANPDGGRSGDFTHSFRDDPGPVALNPDAGEQPLSQTEAEEEGDLLPETSIEEEQAKPGDPQPSTDLADNPQEPAKPEAAQPKDESSPEPDGKVDPSASAANILADLGKGRQAVKK